MVSDPTVTVVIPVFNRAFCVLEAVESVLVQTYPHVECVVVDDGSTDGTLGALQREFGSNSRVVMLHREHAGAAPARNHGLAVASGTYVTFLDSDDLMTDDRIERQLERLSGGSVDAVIGRQLLSAANAPPPDWAQRNPDAFYHTSILTSLAHARQCGGFDERLAIGEDVDFVVRLAAVGLGIAYLDATVVVRRYFGDNLTYRISADDPRPVLGTLRRIRASRSASS